MYGRLHRYRRYLNPSCNLRIDRERIVIKRKKNFKLPKGKPKASDYFTRLEIATLFLQPMAVILLYFGVSWKLFQYTCDVSSPTEFSNSLVWLRNKGTPPHRYIKDN